METGAKENITAARDLFRMQLSILEHNIPIYNIACCEALLGNAKEALEQLQKAVAVGYTDADHMEKDEDLKSLRDVAEFKAIVLALRTPQAKPATTSSGAVTISTEVPVVALDIPVSVQPAVIPVPSSPAEIAPEDPNVELLVGMGFTDRSKNVEALASARGDIATAVQILLNEHRGHRGFF